MGDLPDNVEEDEIKAHFESIGGQGSVTDVELRSTFAFVHFEDSNSAEEAIQKLNNTLVFV